MGTDVNMGCGVDVNGARGAGRGANGERGGGYTLDLVRLPFHLAFAARRALWLRWAGVRLALSVLAPLRPPLRPRATASGSLPVPSVSLITCWSTSKADWISSRFCVRERLGIAPVSHEPGQ